MQGDAERSIIRQIADLGEVGVLLRRLDPRAVIPSAKSDHAAGVDLSACLPEGESLTLAAGAIEMAPTGLAIALPEGFEAQVRPRSGLASRYGVTLVNSPGTIDADYRGEIRAPLINLGREPFTIEHGMRIVQLVIAPVMRPVFHEVDRLDETARGEDGFGSTGLR